MFLSKKCNNVMMSIYFDEISVFTYLQIVKTRRQGRRQGLCLGRIREADESMY